MRRIAFAAIFAFTLLVIGIVYFHLSLAILERAADVSEIEGTVEYLPKGADEWQPLKEHLKVKQGDLVRTGPNSSVLLRWIDGTKVRLAPETELRVEKCYTDTKKEQEISLFQLKIGEIWARIGKRLKRGSRFEIKTPNIVAGVRGTIFSVRVTSPQETQVSVFEGEVVLKTRSGENTLSAGDVSAARADEIETTEMSTEERTQWEERAAFLGPLLVVKEPFEGIEITQGKILVIGQTEPGATVAINGKEISVSRAGLFRALVSVEADENLIEVVAQDKMGHRTTVTRRVKVKSS